MHIIYVYVKFVLRSKFLQSRSKKKQQKSNNKKPEKICENGHHYAFYIMIVDESPFQDLYRYKDAYKGCTNKT